MLVHLEFFFKIRGDQILWIRCQHVSGKDYWCVAPL